MRLLEQIKTVADAYRNARDLSISRVSGLAFGDGTKLTHVMNGADLTTVRFERAMQWFSDNWPADTDWPADVPRPPLSKRGAAA